MIDPTKDFVFVFVTLIIPAIVAISIAIFIIWLERNPPSSYDSFFEKDTIDERKKDLDKWQKW